MKVLECSSMDFPSRQILFCLYIFLFPFGFHLSLKTLLCHGHDLYMNTWCSTGIQSSPSYLLLYSVCGQNLAVFKLWSTFDCIQVVVYNGFYDSNLEWVGLEGVQLVASMNAGTGLGRHKLTSRFTSVVRICNIG